MEKKGCCTLEQQDRSFLDERMYVTFVYEDWEEGQFWQHLTYLQWHISYTLLQRIHFASACSSFILCWRDHLAKRTQYQNGRDSLSVQTCSQWRLFIQRWALVHLSMLFVSLLPFMFNHIFLCSLFLLRDEADMVFTIMLTMMFMMLFLLWTDKKRSCRREYLMNIFIDISKQE